MGCGEKVGDGLGDGLWLGDGLGDGLWLGDGEGVGVAVAEALGLAAGLAAGVVGAGVVGLGGGLNVPLPTEASGAWFVPEPRASNAPEKVVGEPYNVAPTASPTLVNPVMVMLVLGVSVEVPVPQSVWVPSVCTAQKSAYVRLPGSTCSSKMYVMVLNVSSKVACCRSGPSVKPTPSCDVAGAPPPSGPPPLVLVGPAPDAVTAPLVTEAAGISNAEEFVMPENATRRTVVLGDPHEPVPVWEAPSSA
jgi:hypothetical protein